MAQREYYIGSTGPFYYDDATVYPGTSILQAPFVTNGIPIFGSNPLVPNAPVLNSGLATANIFAKLPSDNSIITGDTTVSVVSRFFQLDSTIAPMTVLLPSAIAAYNGFMFIFKDVTGAASTNNIAVGVVASGTINGVATVPIGGAYGSANIICDGLTYWTF